MTESITQRQRLLTFRSGGWVLLLAGVITLTIAIWALAGALVRTSSLRGDGVNVETYGFDLEFCLVPRDQIVAAGMTKDALRPMNDPPTLAGSEVVRINAEQRGKFLVSTDRVIGVSVGGVSRAYPLVILNCHEIVNDTLAGTAIAVTYNPLCDSVVVFDRNVAGEVVEFGVSGLLHNSNMLMYDRRPESVGESLWSQLLGRAVAGPAAMASWRLRVLPSSLVAWGDWLREHPETTVLARDPAMYRRYQQTSYEGYFRTDSLKFPVAVEPPADGPPRKSRVIVVETATARGTWLLADIGRHSDADGVWRAALGDTALRFVHRAEPETVSVISESGDPITVIHTFWFAWHAMHPEDLLLDH